MINFQALPSVLIKSALISLNAGVIMLLKTIISNLIMDYENKPFNEKVSKRCLTV